MIKIIILLGKDKLTGWGPFPHNFHPVQQWRDYTPRIRLVVSIDPIGFWVVPSRSSMRLGRR